MIQGFVLSIQMAATAKCQMVFGEVDTCFCHQGGCLGKPRRGVVLR